MHLSEMDEAGVPVVDERQALAEERDDFFEDAVGREHGGVGAAFEDGHEWMLHRISSRVLRRSVATRWMTPPAAAPGEIDDHRFGAGQNARLLRNAQRIVDISVIAGLIVAASATTAAARPAVSSPEARAGLYAGRVVQGAAEWIFPRAKAPLGVVSSAFPCDRQVDGSYECALRLRVYSSGHWRGRPPSSVEAWACPGVMLVTVRRSPSGRYEVSANEDPCRPSGAPDSTTAGLLFVTAIHRQAPQAGQVLRASCRDAGSFPDSYFHCTARTRRYRSVQGDVLPDGTAQVGAL